MDSHPNTTNASGVLSLESVRSANPLSLPIEHNMAALVFYGSIFVVGVTVNLTALWVFALTTKRKNSVTVYMINVALVDLVLIFLLPFRMVYYHQDYWPFGDAFCRITAALTLFYPCLALWLFALISADRYVAIVQPKHGRELRNLPKAVVACAGVWVMTLGGTAPLLFPEVDPDGASNFTTCAKLHGIAEPSLRDARRDPVQVVRLAFFFLLPVCIMMGCYAVIVDNLVHGRTSKLKPNVKQKSVRIIVTLIVQVLVCFVPFHVCQLVLLLRDPTGGGDGEDGDGGGGERGGWGYSTWAAFTTLLMNLSTVLDIILYYIVSKQFQDRVISVILYRNYLRSVRRKGRHTHTGSVRSMSNLNMI